MVNPTASETTHATRPAPYPMITPSSTAALAAKGAIAVAKAATAATFGFPSTVASAFGMIAGALKVGRVLCGVEKADTHAMMAAKRKASWKVFMFSGVYALLMR